MVVVDVVVVGVCLSDQYVCEVYVDSNKKREGHDWMTLRRRLVIESGTRVQCTQVSAA